MQGMYVLVVMTVLLGWYRSQSTGQEQAEPDATALLTARQMLQIAGVLDHARAQGGMVAALCPGNRPAADLPVTGPDDTVVQCASHNGRVIVWTPEAPGLAAALRRQSRNSKLLARVSGGQVFTLAGTAPWNIALPPVVTDGSLVYIN